MEAGGRATILDQPEGLTIVMPAPRIWPLIGFLAFWLAGWSAGESFALRQLLGPAAAPARAFLTVWVIFWTLGGAGAIAACVWMLIGHERVRLSADALTLRLEVCGIGPAKRYDLGRITGLRAQPPPDLAAVAASSPAVQTAMARAQARGRPVTVDARGALRAIGVASPGITFVVGGRPVRFGTALDPAEAAQVATLLRSRHAFAEDPAAV